jgi:hypothetical protein
MDWGTKKVRIGIAIVVFAAIVLALPLRKAYPDEQLESKVPTFEGDSSKLKQTVILPAFASPMVAGKNNIWCSSFQLAWNEMKDTIVKGPIVATGAEVLSWLMNSARQSKTDLLENSYYVAAGSVAEGIIQKIQSDMARKFPDAPKPTFDPRDALIAYAYLEVYVKFKEPFDENERSLPFMDSAGKQTQLKSFGITQSHSPNNKKIIEQVDLLFCTLDQKDNMTEFALDLCKFTQPYQVVVAMIDPKGTLQQTFETVQEKIKLFPDQQIKPHYRRLQSGEILMVPELFWQINHRFTELLNKPIRGFDTISEAFQMIRFRLDRSGAILKSEAKLAALSAESEPSRLFVLNKPFLIYLKKRDAQQPFFVMWVDNAELLSPK